MIARFDLYDFVANLIPGLVFLWCVQLLAGLVGWHPPINLTGGLSETSILIALGYITGLLLQGLSQSVVEKRILLRLWRGFPSARWLLPDDEHFSAAYKTRLLALIVERFRVAAEPEIPPDCPPVHAHNLRLKRNQELFNLCHHHVGNLSPRPLIFNAHYGLFRCLLGMFALLAALSLAGLVWALSVHACHWTAFGGWTILLGVAAWIAYARCKKRSEDFAQSVYDLFMTGGADKPKSADRS